MTLTKQNDEFKFQDPGPLIDEDLELVLTKTVPGNPERNWVPAYHFRLQLTGTAQQIGSLDLRIGNTEHLIQYGGHLGYNVDSAYRGHAFAARACQLILPLARAHGMSTLWITCNPDNFASARTAERAGAEFVEIVDLPEDNDMYQAGERQKSRYRLSLNSGL